MDTCGTEWRALQKIGKQEGGGCEATDQVKLALV
jgi:hypothetical protein